MARPRGRSVGTSMPHRQLPRSRREGHFVSTLLISAKHGGHRRGRIRQAARCRKACPRELGGNLAKREARPLLAKGLGPLNERGIGLGVGLAALALAYLIALAVTRRTQFCNRRRLFE